jgi:hypothetical protein
VAPRTSEQPSKDFAAVKFWNLSSSEVTLKVAGKTHRLSASKTLELNLPRQFVWKLDDRESQAEQIPAQAQAIEIVIRR